MGSFIIKKATQIFKIGWLTKLSSISSRSILWIYSLTLFYTRGLGILVSHMLVHHPSSFPLLFIKGNDNLTIPKFSSKQ